VLVDEEKSSTHIFAILLWKLGGGKERKERRKREFMMSRECSSRNLTIRF